MSKDNVSFMSISRNLGFHPYSVLGFGNWTNSIKEDLDKKGSYCVYRTCDKKIKTGDLVVVSANLLDWIQSVIYTFPAEQGERVRFSLGSGGYGTLGAADRNNEFIKSYRKLENFSALSVGGKYQYSCQIEAEEILGRIICPWLNEIRSLKITKRFCLSNLEEVVKWGVFFGLLEINPERAKIDRPWGTMEELFCGDCNRTQ